jgi:hypothetical protein
MFVSIWSDGQNLGYAFIHYVDTTARLILGKEEVAG